MPKNEELEKENLNNELTSKIQVESSEKSQSNVQKSKKNVEEIAPNENVVIEKIKSFLSKIIAMQEEAKEELDTKKESKNNKETKSTLVKKVADVPKYMLEYYDLPYRYNETIVKVLAQTPKKLFVYWDIADADRQKYIDTFGNDFFSKTYPVLLLYNEDKQYVREIPINDYANSWYIDINDPKTKYIIQLGRKFIDEPVIVNQNTFNEENIILQSDYLPFAFSNMMEAPNDHVLLESLPDYILFRNIKTNEESLKDLRDLRNVFGQNYDVEEFYKTHYKEELTDGRFDMANPSSKITSSSFK